MWYAIITVVFVQTSGATHPVTQLVPMLDAPTCIRFIASFEQTTKTANPRDIVLAKCEKIAPKAKA